MSYLTKILQAKWVVLVKNWHGTTSKIPAKNDAISYRNLASQMGGACQGTTSKIPAKNHVTSYRNLANKNWHETLARFLIKIVISYRNLANKNWHETLARFLPRIMPYLTEILMFIKNWHGTTSEIPAKKLNHVISYRNLASQVGNQLTWDN